MELAKHWKHPLRSRSSNLATELAIEMEAISAQCFGRCSDLGLGLDVSQQKAALPGHLVGFVRLLTPESLPTIAWISSRSHGSNKRERDPPG